MARYVLDHTFDAPPGFSGGVAKDPYFMYSGFSGQAGGCTANVAGGGVRVAAFSAFGLGSGFSAANAQPQAWVGPLTGTALAASGHMSTSKKLVASWTFTTGAQIGDVLFAKLGLTNGSAIATDDDQIMVRAEAALYSGKFHVVVSRAGTDEIYVTNVTPAANTTYEIAILADTDDRTSQVFINGQSVRPNVFAATTASVALYPYMGVENYGSAASPYFILHRARFEANAA